MGTIIDTRKHSTEKVYLYDSRPAGHCKACSGEYSEVLIC